MQIVLYQPEIPPNTGNVARLCAGTDTELHLIEPLGFKLEDRYLKRAGLDYWPHVRLFVWKDFEAYLAGPGAGKRLVGTSARGGTAVQLFAFTPNDALVLGPETSGLPAGLLERMAATVRIPVNSNIRSLNLSTAAGILLFFALNGAGLLPAEDGPRAG